MGLWQALQQGHDARESMLALQIMLWEVLQRKYDAQDSVLVLEMML